MENQKKNIQVYRIIREAEDCMIQKMMQRSKLSKSNSFDDITQFKNWKLLDYTHDGVATFDNRTDPKTLLCELMKGTHFYTSQP